MVGPKTRSNIVQTSTNTGQQTFLWASLRHLGASWRVLGASWRVPWPILRQLEAYFRPRWGVLAALGASWRVLWLILIGCILGTSGRVLEPIRINKKLTKTIEQRRTNRTSDAPNASHRHFEKLKTSLAAAWRVRGTIRSASSNMLLHPGPMWRPRGVRHFRFFNRFIMFRGAQDKPDSIRDGKRRSFHL